MTAIVVTGGAGFIGSAVIRRLVAGTSHHVVNVDKLTYAANPESLSGVEASERYHFQRLDICDSVALGGVFARFQPCAVIHLAAESHVDRSIDAPAAFIQTNVVGTTTLLSAATSHWQALPADARDAFRFIHVSTDEVYGSLPAEGLFTEETAYAPRSPYAASKAASDHFARAWHHTYGLPVITTNCSNNYGPNQFPEKLIPLTIECALQRKPIPVYGNGEQVRDWLFVEDHASALEAVCGHGVPGRSYNVGGYAQRRNIDVVRAICDLLDELAPAPSHAARRSLITHVPDRPGHDTRYAIDASRIESELSWRAKTTFEIGLRQTVEWYLANPDWLARIRKRTYQGERLGLHAPLLTAS